MCIRTSVAWDANKKSSISGHERAVRYEASGTNINMNMLTHSIFIHSFVLCQRFPLALTTGASSTLNIPQLDSVCFQVVKLCLLLIHVFILVSVLSPALLCHWFFPNVAAILCYAL